ncbi:hypothetical protein [Halovulum dunhuangense]|nr:hypothetical protein [Halovulum dunhuangense]
MKSMIFAFIAIVVIAFAANEGLRMAGFSSAEQTASDSVRLN